MHDEDNYVFVGKNGAIDLTVKENKILQLLIKNKGYVVTHEQICRAIYGDMDHCYDLCMKQKICKLRKKLKNEVEIITVNQIGYKIPTKPYNNIKISYCPFCGTEIIE